MLYGRDAECRVVDDLLEQARRGRSDALVLRGEAGIGKSALLRYAVEKSGDARLLDVRGVEAETAIPFAGLHALLHPVVDRVQLLSPPQRAALGVALGLETGDAPSRFLVSAGLVELLAVLAEDRPLVCLVDDAQWVDPQSLAALTFAGRRLRGDRIATLFALRSDSSGEHGEAARLLAGLRQVELTGLDESATERLLDQRVCGERGSWDRSAREFVKQAAMGNPLALLVLRPDLKADLPAAPPMLTEQLQADYLRRTDGSTAASRHCSCWPPRTTPETSRSCSARRVDSVPERRRWPWPSGAACSG